MVQYHTASTWRALLVVVIFFCIIVGFLCLLAPSAFIGWDVQVFHAHNIQRMFWRWNIKHICCIDIEIFFRLRLSMCSQMLGKFRFKPVCKHSQLSLPVFSRLRSVNTSIYLLSINTAQWDLDLPINIGRKCTQTYYSGLFRSVSRVNFPRIFSNNGFRIDRAGLLYLDRQLLPRPQCVACTENIVHRGHVCKSVFP